MLPTKKKLDGIATGANNYVHPATTGNKHIPTGGKAGQVLKWAADGTAKWDTDANTTYKLVTASSDGLMSKADKTKLDGIAAGANKYVHPTTAGNKHIPAGGAANQILRWSAAGTAVWGADGKVSIANNDTTNNASMAASAAIVYNHGLEIDKNSDICRKITYNTAEFSNLDLPQALAKLIDSFKSNGTYSGRFKTNSNWYTFNMYYTHDAGFSSGYLCAIQDPSQFYAFSREPGADAVLKKLGDAAGSTKYKDFSGASFSTNVNSLGAKQIVGCGIVGFNCSTSVDNANWSYTFTGTCSYTQTTASGTLGRQQGGQGQRPSGNYTATWRVYYI